MPSDAKKKREQKKKEAAKGKNKKTTKENGVNGVETNGISNGEITANGHTGIQIYIKPHQ
jgi:hypothetical protein